MSDAIGYHGEGGQAANQSAYFQNLYDRRAEWGPTYFDATHMFNFSYTYELPFGRNKTFGSDWHPAMNGILGGWHLGGILTLRSGFPLTIQQATDRSGTRSRGPRADRVGDGEGPRDVGPGTRGWTRPLSGSLLRGPWATPASAL
jgi:hypothetical protein